MKHYCLITFLFLSFVSLGQIKYGPSVNIGVAAIRGSELKGYIHSLQSNQSNVTSANIKFNPKLLFGFGGFIQYQLKPKAYIFSEITINYFRANISQTIVWDRPTNNFFGEKERISSEANLRSLYIQMPIIFKYTIWEKKKLSILSGFSISLSGKPTLDSKDIYVYNQYSEVIDSTLIIERSSKFKLNKFNTFHIAGVIGVEKKLKKELKRVTLGATFIYEITKSKLYSTSSTLCGDNSNNSVFQECGKNEIESNYPTFNLNNFRILSFNLSVKYNITKNLIKKTE